MLQVQLIYDAKNMHPDFQTKINTEYVNELSSYINRVGTSVIIPREGEHLEFRVEWTDNEGKSKTHVNTFRINRVIYNITDKVLKLSIIKL